MAEPAAPKIWSVEELKALARREAEKRGLNVPRFLGVVTCENITWEPGRQSDLKYKEGNRWGFAAGAREKSFGLAMIHLPDHPEISHAQATDPEWALSWMADEWEAGRAWQWTCYHK